MNEQKLIDLALSLGAYQAAVIPVSRIHFDKSFRSLCESNACGNFGMCWMCPPDVGDIVKLIEEAKTFQSAWHIKPWESLRTAMTSRECWKQVTGITGWLKKFPAHSLPPFRENPPFGRGRVPRMPCVRQTHRRALPVSRPGYGFPGGLRRGGV